jgi:hypothetical protein
MVLAAAACGSDAAVDAGPDARVCLVGDAEAEPEIELVYRTIDGEMAPLVDGQEAPLILPPQGGKVFIVGVKARNVDVCGARLAGALRDPCNGRVVGLERRNVFLVPGDGGWAIPRQPRELSDYANIPVCPNFVSDLDADRAEMTLEITLTDGRGREASARATVRPTCAEPQFAEQCACECDADYRLGDPCPEDGEHEENGECPEDPRWEVLLP